MGYPKIGYSRLMRFGKRRREMKTKVSGWSATAAFLGVLSTFIGCKNVHPPGPVLALYAKDGGPAFQKSPGTYDPLIVDDFFRSHPDVLPSFVDRGVCSLKTDPMSDEATVNGIICQSAANVSFGIGMKKFQEENR